MTLSDLLTQIEEETQKNIDIQNNICDAQKDLLRIKCENLLYVNEPENSFSEIFNQLPLEHQDVIIDVLNRIEDLRNKFDSNKNKILTLLTDIERIFDLQNESKLDIILSSKSKNIDSIFNDTTISEISLYETQIKELMQATHTMNSRIKRDETELTKQIELEESLVKRDNGEIDLKNEIENIDSVIVKKASKIEKGIGDIIDIQEMIAEDETAFERDMAKIESLYSCVGKHEALRQEAESINETIATNKLELEEIERRIHTNEKRYKILKRIQQKDIVNEIDENKFAFELYEDLKIAKEKYNNKEKKNAEELKNIKKDIERLENKKELLCRKFYKIDSTLEPIISNVKSDIKTQKKEIAEKELELTKSLSGNDKNSFKKSSIPRFKPKRNISIKL